MLALDGIDYRDVINARERGLFAGFREPSRLISTFPSISDVAWHDIFGVQPPRGYQRIFYSTAQNTVLGAPLDAIRPIEFEDRMDLAFGAKFHHLGAYLISNTIARREVDVAVRDFFKQTGRSTVYVYNVGPDALQHTRGDLVRYLQHLDEQLNALQAEYLRRTGRPLEIVVLSDHGHNRAVEAKFLPVVKSMQASGYRIAEQLSSPMDVAFSVDGVTTGFGVFCAPDSMPAIARLLAATEGVDLVTVREAADRFRILRANEEAVIERRHTLSGERFRYVTRTGDPLRYAPVITRMRAEAALDADGFADSPTWVRYTAATTYPAAPERIVRGHTSITLNPAPILVSIDDGYRVGLGLVSVANRMRPLGGTHGALSQTNATGVLMTNFRDTHDDVTSAVRAQLDSFADLRNIQRATSGARLTSSWLLGRDPRGPFRGMMDTTDAAVRRAAVEVWLTTKELRWARGSPTFALALRSRSGDAAPRSTAVLTPRSVVTARSDGGDEAPQEGYVSQDSLHYAFPIDRLRAAALAPSATYELRVRMERVDTLSGRARRTSRDIVTLTLKTNALGELWPY